jgi:hypothetical protein
MNNIKDFKKKESGAVVNTNSSDCMRARNRNHTRRVQNRMFGTINTEGDIDKVIRYQNHDHSTIKHLKNKISRLELMLEALIEEKK